MGIFMINPLVHSLKFRMAGNQFSKDVMILMVDGKIKEANITHRWW
jgi:hypothetical protein